MTHRNLSKANFLSPSKRVLKRAKQVAKSCNTFKDKYRKLSNKDLSNMTNVFIARIASGESLDDIMPEAFAAARETVWRVHKMFAYDVQIMGAAVIHFGDFAELYTGEGKTLVCVIAAYLDALLKKGVHIVTVNEYLVQRDAKFCAECLNPLGITVGYNLSTFSPDQKRKMFNCDITYTTNSELGFDYLRDNMVRRHEDKVIRTLMFAICDEGDSILIDEARTPLIISGQPKRDVTQYVEADRFVKKLVGDDYKIDAESNSITLTDSGIGKAQVFFKLENLFSIENSELYHKIKNALMANFVFEAQVEYIVREDKIVLIDQFTGRILEGRSYNAGLQQAIQAKEYVQIEPENIIVATITYQSFFRLYKKLAGASGTAYTESEEFMKIYNMVVVKVPTNKPVIRKDLNDYVFANKLSKWVHVCAEIEKVHKSTGQPILVGTGSVEDSEELCKFLRNKGLNFELLNAKNHAREAEIVKGAGQINSITISTNMAGRGTDIKLGEGVRELGGLYVIGTDRSESRRVDNQLRGRSGRQGDPGITRFFISLQDTLFKRFATEKLDKSNDVIDNDYYDSWFFTRLLNSTQKKVEGLNFDTRKNLIDYDSVLSSQRELIYKQRDQILLTSDNIKLISNMARHLARSMAESFINKQDNIFIEKEKIAQAINMRILNANIIAPNIFNNKNLEEATEIITEIIKISIDKRISKLGQDQAARILKDIIIQNLDYNWTNHIDKMTKVREGVSLRSLEQRSPLNIYVEEADKNFTQLKKNVAIGSVTSFHRIFVPNFQNEIRATLSAVLPGSVIEVMTVAENHPVIKDIESGKAAFDSITNLKNSKSLINNDVLVTSFDEAKVLKSVVEVKGGQDDVAGDRLDETTNGGAKKEEQDK